VPRPALCAARRTTGGFFFAWARLFERGLLAFARGRE